MPFGFGMLSMVNPARNAVAPTDNTGNLFIQAMETNAANYRAEQQRALEREELAARVREQQLERERAERNELTRQGEWQQTFGFNQDVQAATEADRQAKREEAARKAVSSTMAQAVKPTMQGNEQAVQMLLGNLPAGYSARFQHRGAAAGPAAAPPAGEPAARAASLPPMPQLSAPDPGTLPPGRLGSTFGAQAAMPQLQLNPALPGAPGAPGSNIALDALNKPIEDLKMAVAADKPQEARAIAESAGLKVTYLPKGATVTESRSTRTPIGIPPIPPPQGGPVASPNDPLQGGVVVVTRPDGTEQVIDFASLAQQRRAMLEEHIATTGAGLQGLAAQAWNEAAQLARGADLPPEDAKKKLNEDYLAIRGQMQGYETSTTSASLRAGAEERAQMGQGNTFAKDGEMSAVRELDKSGVRSLVKGVNLARSILKQMDQAKYTTNSAGRRVMTLNLTQIKKASGDVGAVTEGDVQRMEGSLGLVGNIIRKGHEIIGLEVDPETEMSFRETQGGILQQNENQLEQLYSNLQAQQELNQFRPEEWRRGWTAPIVTAFRAYPGFRPEDWEFGPKQREYAPPPANGGRTAPKATGKPRPPSLDEDLK